VRCGKLLATVEPTWEQICDVMAAVTGKDAAEMKRESWLRYDLGFI
jgi:hypothetical protein